MYSRKVELEGCFPIDHIKSVTISGDILCVRNEISQLSGTFLLFQDCIHCIILHFKSYFIYEKNRMVLATCGR